MPKSPNHASCPLFASQGFHDPKLFPFLGLGNYMVIFYVIFMPLLGAFPG
jgi:hypothetical protein